MNPPPPDKMPGPHGPTAPPRPVSRWIPPPARPAQGTGDGGACGPPPPSRSGAPGAEPPAAPPLGAPPSSGARLLADPFALPAANWTWPFAVAGLAAGVAPELLLYAVALAAGSSSSATTEVTALTAAALVIGSLVVYGWQALAAWWFSLRPAGRAPGIQTAWAKLSLWGFRRPTRAFFWTIPLSLAGVYAVSIAHNLVVHPRQQDILTAFPRSQVGLGLFVVIAVVMAPLFEEIVFRGFLFRGLANSWGWVAGALVSAGIFGLAHLQLDVFVPLAALGFALAWVYKRSGSLWTSITLHALFNGIAVLAWAATT